MYQTQDTPLLTPKSRSILINWGTKNVYACLSISLYMYRYFHSMFLMANLWNSEVVVRFCFLFVFWHMARWEKTLPISLLSRLRTTPPEATSCLETFARLAFLSQKEVTFKSTLKCVNIRHSLVLGFFLLSNVTDVCLVLLRSEIVEPSTYA